MRSTKALRAISAGLALLAGTWILPTNAATQGPGYVTYLAVQNGVAIVAMNGTVTGAWPVCATLTRFAFVTTTAAGQAWYTALLAAKFAVKPVTIIGANNCSAWGDSETLSWMNIEA